SLIAPPGGGRGGLRRGGRARAAGCRARRRRARDRRATTRDGGCRGQGHEQRLDSAHWFHLLSSTIPNGAGRASEVGRRRVRVCYSCRIQRLAATWFAGAVVDPRFGHGAAVYSTDGTTAARVTFHETPSSPPRMIPTL